MAIRTNYEPGDPCWADLMTPDIAAASQFYTEVLGWSAGEANGDFGGYMMFLKDGQPVAGAMQWTPEDGAKSSWTIYLSVKDAAEAVSRAEANGASVFVTPQVVGELGTMAVFGDAAGAVVGVWAPNQFSGFGVYDQSGAPSWFEHHSRDYNSAVSFYRSVFDWDLQPMSDTDEFRYSTANHGEHQFAGFMDSSSFLAEGDAAQWAMYVGVDSVDDACAAVKRLGGTVLDEPADTPYGRIAAVADMACATFRLRQT